MKKIKVMIVDDSLLIRQILVKELSKYDDIEVVGSASNPIEAKPLILKYKPDVLTLDVEMPKMDGLTFLSVLQKFYPVPVVMLSSLTEEGSRLAIEALERGATEVMQKPGGGSFLALGGVIDELYFKIKAAALAKKVPSSAMKLSLPVKGLRAASVKTNMVIAIGSSTGGTEALRYIIPQLPVNLPPIVIAQHMPEKFTESFANSLDRVSAVKVVECSKDVELRSGLAVIARGGMHMVIRKMGGRYFATLQDGERVHHQKPSVDVLFWSVAKEVGKDSVGVILTGMGRDGADGLLAMKKKGAYTVAQDEKTSVVYGMPKSAVELNAACKVLPLDRIPQEIISAVKA